MKRRVDHRGRAPEPPSPQLHTVGSESAIGAMGKDEGLQSRDSDNRTFDPQSRHSLFREVWGNRFNDPIEKQSFEIE